MFSRSKQYVFFPTPINSNSHNTPAIRSNFTSVFTTPLFSQNGHNAPFPSPLDAIETDALGETSRPKKHRRIGYLNPTSLITKITHETIPLIPKDRIATQPSVINEEEYDALANKVKKELTREMREAARDIDFDTQDKTLFHKELPHLVENWNPYEQMDLSKSLYPPKKHVQPVEDFNEYNRRYPDPDSEYVVQTSTKLVRNHNSTTVEKRKLAQAAVNGMTWTRDQVLTEQINTSSDSIEPEVMIQLEEQSSLSTNPSPSGSPNRVVVVCEKPPVYEKPLIPKLALSPAKRPKQAPVYNKSQMSLRVINGQRITGDSKECYSFMTNSCKLGIFCRYEHNGSTQHGQTKVCHRLLRGLCRPDNQECPLEHEALLPHQYPNCVFFLRGDCTAGDRCTLLHVKHNSRIPPCLEFLRGKCTKGSECDYPHSYPWTITKEKGTAEHSRKGANHQPEEQTDTFPWIDD